MMHRSIDRKLRLFFYLILFLLLSTQISKNNIKDHLFPGKTSSDESFFELAFDKIADVDRSIEKTSKLIAENEIVATCYKNIETGPRALGHRSLLCNAHNSELIKKI